MTSFARTLVVVIVGLVTSGVAAATEGGGSNIAVGVNTVMAGVMEPPGTYLKTFIAHYDANQTLDSSGDDRAGIANFRVTVDAVNFRLSHIWNGVEFRGATIETRVGFTAYVDARVKFDVQAPAGTIHREGSAHGSGDALLAPALLGWHSERYHQIAGIELFLPTATFDPARIANTSRGYYTIAPAYFFTWFPTPGIEVSGNATYLFNLKNRETRYRSGDEIALDYGVGYALGDAWQIGASGYVYQQVGNDEQNGRIVAEGNRGKTVAIGPFVRYRDAAGWGIVFKWQHELSVENKTAGDRLWLQFALKLR